jgi:thiol-disulfide isomerase/thioredoxin
MKNLFISILLAFCVSVPGSAQAPAENTVLQKVMQIYQTQGHVTFSDLYNSDQFNPEEKAFLGRLYEVFFSIPAFLKTDFESTGRFASRAQIAGHFGISPHSVTLLLSLMEKDGRVPKLFTRDPSTQEITALNLENIDLFVKDKGASVKMTQWEGQSLPEFSVQLLDGGTFDSAQLLGKPALIYFWFTGCPPCVRIAPILSELHAEYGNKGIRFLGLNADEQLEIGTDDASRIQYLAKQGIRFENGNVSEATQQSFGNINVYPTLFFVSADGKIINHMVNFQSREKLVPVVKQLLGE